MKKYMNKSPEEVMKMVTTELITRGIKLGRKKKRTLYIHKRASDPGVSFEELNPMTQEGKERLDKFLTPIKLI
ncbi:MAG: Bacterial transferase hexapeptide [Acidobacteriota bacterium]|nr:Bacterial transferase hexapeptide [Acidobacteriota bacterium]